MESQTNSRQKSPPPGYSEDTVTVELSAWDGTEQTLSSSFKGTDWIVQQVVAFINSNDDGRLLTQISLHRTASTPDETNRILGMLYGAQSWDARAEEGEGSSTAIKAIASGGVTADTYLTVKYFYK